MYPGVMSLPIVEMESFKYMKNIIVLICQMVVHRFCDNLTFGHTLLILPLEPSSTPQAVTVSATSSKSIFVSWDPVTADDRNGIIKGYIVNYQALPNGYIVAKILNITNEEQNNRQTVTLSNLNEFTNYSIGVLAFTVFGNGPVSVSQVVETLEDSKFYASNCAIIFTLCLLEPLIALYRQHCQFSYERFLFFIKKRFLFVLWTQKQYFVILSVLYCPVFYSSNFFSFDFLIILPNPKQLKGTCPLDSRLLSGDFLISGRFLLPNARSQLLRQFYFWSYKPP